MSNGIPIKEVNPPKIYRETITSANSIAITNAWGNVYIGSRTFTINNLGDLTQKDVFVSFNGQGGTAAVSIDNITSNGIGLTFVRGTPTSIFGELVVYAYDR